MGQTVTPSPHPRSTRAELARTASWVRAAGARRDGRGVARSLASGGRNVVDAVLDRLRPAGYWCPCCATASTRFVHLVSDRGISWNSACPRCFSRGRHRALAPLLAQRLTEEKPDRVLHFAPEPQLARGLDPLLADSRYVTTDLYRDDVDATGEDIQSLSFADGSFDLVVCNHVLEHVPDDRRAVQELRRVLAPGGVAVVSVPGDWGRSETEEFAAPDSNGHLRLYGASFAALLDDEFDRVERIALGGRPGPDGLSLGVRADDCAFACSTSTAAGGDGDHVAVAAGE